MLWDIFKSSNRNTKPASAPVSRPVEPEEYFHGVPLAELSDLAKTINKGIRCSLDNSGFLIFHYWTNRGNITVSAQNSVDENRKLYKLFSYHYPGQNWCPLDDFIEKANETFTFTPGRPRNE